MKSKEEIKQLALLKYPRVIHDPYNPIEDDNSYERKIWIDAYTQCQEDIGKELEALRAAIRKNTWYDIDGNAQVNLFGIDNNLLNKQD